MIVGKATYYFRVIIAQMLDCERKWAQGMNSKKQMTDIGKDIKTIKYHVKRKFKKSVTYSKHLLELSKLTCDAGTILEAEAYYLNMEANYLKQMTQIQNFLKDFSKIIKVHFMVLIF